MIFFLKGMLMGMLVCTAPGPILTVIFKEGLKRGFKFALHFGMGVAVIDVIFCLLAFGGIMPILASFPSFIPTMWLLGGLIFLALGIFDLYETYKSHGQLVEAEKYQNMDYSHPFKKGLLISLFNPGAVLFWLSVSGALASFGGRETNLFVLGVALGSPLWFFILAHIIAHVRGKMTEKFLYYFTLLAGIILIAVGIFFINKFIVTQL